MHIRTCWSWLDLQHNYIPLSLQGEISTNNEIVLNNVNICVPSQSQNGTEDNGFSGSMFHSLHVHLPLVKDLLLVLKQGEHMMITGSNRVGKTSVARVLAGLWAAGDSGDLFGGQNTWVQRPPTRSDDGR